MLSKKSKDTVAQLLSGGGDVSHAVGGNGADEIGRALQALGVTRAFGVCGDHVNALYRACTLHGIEIIGARSESAAVQMADGLARATGFPGVAIVTGGPGHTNAVTGLAVAQSAASPVIVLSGQTPVSQRERGGQQVLHQAEIVRSLTKFALEVPDASDLAEYTARAFQIAASGTPGPVSLSLPLDVLTGRVSERGRAYVVRPHGPADASWSSVQHNDIAGTAELISGAQRPVLIVGSGAWPAFNRDALTTCVQRLGMPAFTIDQARGLVSDDGRSGFGYADPRLNHTFREVKRADLLVLVGASIDFHTCFGGKQLVDPACKIVQIHRDSTRLGICRSIDIGMDGPVRPLLESLAEHVVRRGTNANHAAWLEDVRRRFSENKAEWQRATREAMAVDKLIHPLQVCASLERHFTDDTVIVIDGGDFVHWPRAYFGAKRVGHWMDNVSIASLGGALPLGIGAQIAFPDDPVWIFIGDGGFGFYSWELATAVERKLPIKIILGNDAAWGIEKRLQLSDYGEYIGCDLPYTRYDRFAEMVGAKGFHADDRDDLDAAIDAIAKEPGPCLLNVDIRPLAGRPLVDFL